MERGKPPSLDVSASDAELASHIRVCIANDNPDAIGLLGQLADNLVAQERDLEALSMRERALVLIKEHYGLEAEWFAREAEQLTLRCNTLAMQHLRDQKPAVAIKLLHKAEALTDPRGVMYRHPRRHSLRAVTLNNLGCYYKEQRKYHTALSYLQRALKLEADAGLRDNPAGTHLNMCAILSHMHRHREALQHSKLALEMVLLDEEEKEEAGVQHEAATQLTDVMREHASASDDTPAAEGQGQAPGTEQGAAGGEGEGAAAGEGEEGEGEGKEEDTSLLAIAYFNMAVQHEHLHELDLALGAYDSAVGAAERDLGSEHPMTEGMRRTLEAVERTARKAAASGGGRRSPRNSPRGLPSATVFDRLSARYNPPAERDVLGSPRSPRGSPRGGVGADSFNTARTQRRSPRGGAQPATTRRVTNSTTAAGASAVR